MNTISYSWGSTMFYYHLKHYNIMNAYYSMNINQKINYKISICYDLPF